MNRATGSAFVGTWRRRTLLALTLVAALLMTMMPMGAASAASTHCPGSGGEPLPSGYTNPVKVEANGGNQSAIDSTIPAAGTYICVKSGTSETGNSTGIIVADGTTTLRGYLFNYGIIDGTGTAGRNVSYYMTYTGPGGPTPAGLGATKTAVGAFDRTVTWDLTKTASPTSHTGAPGDTRSSTWTVTATKIDSGPQNYTVSGAVTITNTNNFAVPVTVADTLLKPNPDYNETDTEETDPEFLTLAVDVLCGAVADDPNTPADETVAGTTNAGSVPANGSLVCTYNKSVADSSWTANLAQITSGDSRVNGTSAAIAIGTYAERLTGSDTAVLDDPEVGTTAQSITSSTTLTGPVSHTCSTNWADYTNNQYSVTENNTATLTPTGGSQISRSASVVFNCVRPFQGLTPGFWKQTQHYQFWTILHPTDHTVGGTFSGASTDSTTGHLTAGNLTTQLVKALDWSNGSTIREAKQKLIRQAIAALNNADHPDVNYSLTRTQILTRVNNKLGLTNTKANLNAINGLATLLDGYNNLGRVNLK